MANRPPPLSIVVSDDRRRLVVAWPDGRTATAPAPWLFDNAEGALDPASGHRLGGALALEGARSVLSAGIDGDAVVVRFAPGGEERRVLLAALLPPAPDRRERELWASPHWLERTPPVDFGAYLSDDRPLAAALEQVAARGIVFVTAAGGFPGTVERVVERFGYIRETNYGRLFDVREEAVPTHLAYTAIGLELHTDNPYRDPEPTLQLLHVIEAAPEGGESLFVDGFAHVQALRAEAPAHFDVLAATPAPFAYSGPAGERYSARVPVIETTVDGELKAVRVSHQALGAIPLTAGAERWYEAYLDLYRRLNAPAARIERKLAAGEVVMFDNRRILHGRRAYAAGGRRWLQGCYAERDGLLATLARLAGARVNGGSL